MTPQAGEAPLVSCSAGGSDHQPHRRRKRALAQLRVAFRGAWQAPARMLLSSSSSTTISSSALRSVHSMMPGSGATCQLLARPDTGVSALLAQCQLPSGRRPWASGPSCSSRPQQEQRSTRQRGFQLAGRGPCGRWSQAHAEQQRLISCSSTISTHGSSRGASESPAVCRSLREGGIGMQGPQPCPAGCAARSAAQPSTSTVWGCAHG